MRIMRPISSILALLFPFVYAGLFQAAPRPAALTGIVSSDAQAPMEGVLVNAKRLSGTITVSVVSDENGRYNFPAARLTSGTYQLTVRAVGFVAANAPITVNVGVGTVKTDIRLNKTSDLAPQLSDVEWLMSIPGTYEQKQNLFINCAFCHTLAPVMNSRYDAAAWMKTLVRMRDWIPASFIDKPIRSPFPATALPGDEEFATYLSSINLSSAPTHPYELKMLPRPHGAETRVIVTEYDLPRPDAEPHDAVMDSQSMVWYSDYAEPIVGRLNPRTGEVREFRNPLVKGATTAAFCNWNWIARATPGLGGQAPDLTASQNSTRKPGSSSIGAPLSNRTNLVPLRKRILSSL